MEPLKFEKSILRSIDHTIFFFNRVLREDPDEFHLKQ